ncbi:hypothetical protein QBC35DRAFT_515215 [Podospora australis]|uniref:Tat pathway signal sequence n=1 Tax=Podospora australis TaxID=1536484 RepID=A0AAN6WSX3_9PEZI|nr:hypothetical protein QBC35DRAFT_515215 [Podospora australis]
MHTEPSTPEARPLATKEIDDTVSDLDTSSDEGKWEVGHPTSHHQQEWHQRNQRWLFTCVLLLVISNVITLFAGTLIGLMRVDLDSACAKYTTQWSPVLKHVPITYSWRWFNGSFMEEDIYRQPGSPEVDAAWEDLGLDSNAMVISYEDGIKSGLTDAHLQRADKYGGGFFVNVEGLHHLHCLNLLRKSLWYNFDYYKNLGTHAFANDENILSVHVSHCLDTLRQVLMCNVDTGVLGQVWYSPEEATAFPDFKTRHKCKNYDDIRKWAVEMQQPPPESTPEDYLKPPKSEDILPATP